MFVLPQEVYAYLISLGVSPASAAGILANIQAESRFEYTNATGDGGTSGGLFQHHLGRWDRLKAYAISRGTTWDADWRIQVDFAMQEPEMSSFNLQATNAQEAAKQFSLVFEKPAGGQQSANARAANVNTFTFGALPAGSGDASPQAGNEVLNLPTGGSWFKVGRDHFVAFRFYGDENKEGPSQVVYFKATMPPPPGETIHSEAAWNQFSGPERWVDGGTTDTFRGVAANQSYQDLVDQVLLDLGLMGSDALQDVGVMAVVAIAMTRDMSRAEITNRLRQTAWWNARTELQREWNDLSDAEKNLRTVDAALEMVGLWFTYLGQDLNVGQYDTDADGAVSAEELRRGNVELFEWAAQIASGAATQVMAVNVWMKALALEDPNSPWSRTVRDEEIASGEFDVDVSNMAGSIKDEYNDWGIPISDRRADELALEVVMNRLSFEDVTEELRAQAQGLYPHKPENMSTREWAEPYMQTYMQTLELPQVELDNPSLSRALADGVTLGDYRQTLRQDDRWLETDGARTEMNEGISSLGRVMGF